MIVLQQLTYSDDLAVDVAVVIVVVIVVVVNRLSYMRVATCITYFFYKNLTFTTPLFWFGVLSMFGGQTAYDAVYISCYNMVFTAAPVVVSIYCSWLLWLLLLMMLLMLLCCSSVR